MLNLTHSLKYLQHFVGREQKSALSNTDYVWLYGHFSNKTDGLGSAHMDSATSYQHNPIAHRCVKLIAQNAASIKLEAFGDNRQECESQLLKLIHRPSKDRTGKVLLEELYSFLHIYGNGFLHLIKDDDRPIALHLLHPECVDVEQDGRGNVSNYTFRHGAHKCRYGPDSLGRFDVFHTKFFDPTNSQYGHSPMKVAQIATDLHQQGAIWNRSLLNNSARPSGALIFSGTDGTEKLSEEQFDRLRHQLDNAHSGIGNAGRPLLLEGGLSWTPMALSPSEMDFLEARREAAREIALSFGVPPMLLGIPGDNTYANYKEANLAFWKQTILPLASSVIDSLSHWLGAHFSQDFELRLNLDEIPALSSERDAFWARLNRSDFLTQDEKREAAGYPPLSQQDQKQTRINAQR